MYTENIDTPIYLVRSYKDLVDQPEHPDLTGPPTPGRIYFTGKITTVLSLEQKIRTGSSNPYSRRKNQKSRPWLVLEVKNDGSFVVISLTTRNNLVWKGLKEKDARSFLPLGTTPGYEGRDNVELLSNVYGIFKGTSLIFLEVEKTVYRDSLGHCIGEITADGLDLVLRERGLYRLQTAVEEEAKRERAFAEREEHRLRIFLEREAQKLRFTQEREMQRLRMTREQRDNCGPRILQRGDINQMHLRSPNIPPRPPHARSSSENSIAHCRIYHHGEENWRERGEEGFKWGQ
ncbi:hypothetical protein DFP73DRAFT_523770 [Morchella snyderi]|nr:hypothetical protein DFP73DRAFT_523770 [Morchella snyderi]